MIQRKEIQDAVIKYIAGQMKCRVEDLHTDETVFIKDEDRRERYIKILSVGNTKITGNTGV